ncbi:hypothetical protein IG193_08700 [Infirmifilum lucidum]|uniref:CRISPR type III-associated protein domain-containing protein n=1 Tax=Infirmifilum lucidum TaxID=2776706 RepID=A0A7L9FK97_9CREN|nr:hypothetical protein IG193_08700 [Infirmifilum lucidum]
MVRIEVELKPLSSLTVGGSSPSSSADIPFNRLLVPPSTIKGSMRTAVTALLPDCYTACGEVEPRLIRLRHGKMGGPCDVCKLFGYPDSPGRVYVTVESQPGEFHLLSRVSIDDERWVAEEKKLFSQQVIKPGETIVVSVAMDTRGLGQDEEERLVRLLLYSLHALRLWRLGRGAMVDLRVRSHDLPEDKYGDLLEPLKRWLWE